MSEQLTVEQIEELARAVTRAKQLHPSWQGEGDTITLNAVGPVRHVYDLTVRVSVNAEQASRLPGFPGTQHEDEVDPPITGLDLLLGEAQHAAQEAVALVLFHNHGLRGQYNVGPGPDGGVIFAHVAIESAQDRLF